MVGGLGALVATALLVVDVLGGPLTLILLAISALLGGVMYSVIRKVEQQFGDLTKVVSDGSKTMGAAATEGMGQTDTAAQKLADKLKDIEDQIVKANRDFTDQLTTIVTTHEQKVSALTKQIQQEKDDFAQAQQDKTDSFKQSQADMATTHQQQVDDLTKQINAELLKGRFADQTRLEDLRTRLQRENDSYALSTAQKLAQYNKDTTNAQEQSQDKVTSLQQQLDAETSLLQKHASDG